MTHQGGRPFLLPLSAAMECRREVRRNYQWIQNGFCIALSACPLPGKRVKGEGLNGIVGIGTVTKGKAAVVLIVEDDREMLSLLCDEFWSLDYQVRQARDGDEALRLVLESMPDVILTDLRMPAGGPDYISRLRTIAPRCPIVVMTAFGDTQGEQDVLKAGADAYFNKPVRIAELKACVQRLLVARAHDVASGCRDEHQGLGCEG
jgi:CheY-like chemotaxis protein